MGSTTKEEEYGELLTTMEVEEEDGHVVASDHTNYGKGVDG